MSDTEVAAGWGKDAPAREDDCAEVSFLLPAAVIFGTRQYRDKDVVSGAEGIRLRPLHLSGLNTRNSQRAMIACSGGLSIQATKGLQLKTALDISRVSLEHICGQSAGLPLQ